MAAEEENRARYGLETQESEQRKETRRKARVERGMGPAWQTFYKGMDVPVEFARSIYDTAQAWNNANTLQGAARKQETLWKEQSHPLDVGE